MEDRSWKVSRRLICQSKAPIRELGGRADIKNLEGICSDRVSREGKETVYEIRETEEQEVLDELVVGCWYECSVIDLLRMAGTIKVYVFSVSQHAATMLCLTFDLDLGSQKHNNRSQKVA